METLTRPAIDQYVGMTYDQAQQRAKEICSIAADTGQTVMAYYHLQQLVGIMTVAVENTQALHPAKDDPVAKWKSLSG